MWATITLSKLSRVSTGLFKNSDPPLDFTYGCALYDQILWRHVKYQEGGNSHLWIGKNLINSLYWGQICNLHLDLTIYRVVQKSQSPVRFYLRYALCDQILLRNVMYQISGNSHLWISQNLIIHCFEGNLRLVPWLDSIQGGSKKLVPTQIFSLGQIGLQAL